MYITRNMLPARGEDFDWSSYFAGDGARELMGQSNPLELMLYIRELLGESRPQFTYVVTRMLRTLLRGIDLNGKRVLELGAGTGFLTRWLVHQHEMSGMLVDNNAEARRAFDAMDDDTKQKISYVMADLFEYQTSQPYDVVCSFGVIEHFKDKTDVLRAHENHLADDGHVVLLVPMDSPLSRVYYEVYPELNLGYRELWNVKDFKQILTGYGFDIVTIETSRGYSYDMMGAVCRRGKASR